MAATFRARYEGRCPDCGAEIFTGDLLTYNEDGQAVHIVCSSDKTVLARVAVHGLFPDPPRRSVRPVTLQVKFEIGDTDPESEMTKMLLEIQKLAPSPEHDRICGQLMILRGTQLLERAAAAEALGNYQDKIVARRRATVARKAAQHANEA